MTVFGLGTLLSSESLTLGTSGRRPRRTRRLHQALLLQSCFWRGSRTYSSSRSWKLRSAPFHPLHPRPMMRPVWVGPGAARAVQRCPLTSRAASVRLQ